MSISKMPSSICSQIKSPTELGKLIRTYRKEHQLTLQKVSNVSHLGMRFLSELERGKESAELGKVLQVLHNLGLEIIIQSRGYKHKVEK